MHLKSILQKFDDKLEFSEFDINDIYKELKAISEISNDECKEDLNAEILAFSFVENHHLGDKDFDRKYYSERYQFTNINGEKISIPSKDDVTEKNLDYWKIRANETNNQILKVRYSGLYIDFCKNIKGINAPTEIRKIFIFSSIDIYRFNIRTILYLKRALYLAIKTNDKNSIELIKSKLYEIWNSNLDFSTSLHFEIFDLVFFDKKANLLPIQENKLIQDFERSICELSLIKVGEKRAEPILFENICVRLAGYYFKKNKKSDTQRILLELGLIITNWSNSQNSIQTHIWLERLHNIFLRFNLNYEANQILNKIHEIGPQVIKEMGTISTSYDIPMNKFIEFLDEMSKGTPKDIFLKIIFEFLPDKSKIESELIDANRIHNTRDILNQKKFDSSGRVISTMEPLSKNLEGHIIDKISMKLSINSVLLNQVLSNTIKIKAFSKQDVLIFLSGSKIIKNERLVIFERALDAYFQNDYYAFVHLIIPQIEQSIRNFYQLLEGISIKVNNNSSGGYLLKVFDELLRDDKIRTGLGDNLVYYFRTLFTDNRGWNIRNKVCHGIVNPEYINAKIADTVFHALLCLGLIQENLLTNDD